MISIGTKVDADGAFGPIDLKDEKRAAIDRIEAVYRTRIFSGGKGSAIVEIWGTHDTTTGPAPAVSTPSPQSPSPNPADAPNAPTKN